MPRGPGRLDVEHARFVRSVVAVEERPLPRLPEVAFSGRSNVGKSSLLNVLLRRKRLALISGRPGKTQALNFFEIGGACYFVDLPGYGFAKAPARLRRAWRPMVERYLRGSPELRGVVQLVDARQPPSDLDRAMLAFLAGAELPALVVLTKVDKLGAAARPGRLDALRAELGLADDEQVVAFSAVTREGRDEVLHAIEDLLSSAGPVRTRARAREPFGPNPRIGGPT
jgi:GTP-binding protein